MKRKVCDELGLKKNLQIAALFANTNLDGDEGHQNRIKIIESFEDSFKDAVAYVYDDHRETKKVDEDNAFMAAGKKAMKWLDDVAPAADAEAPSFEDKFGDGLTDQE